MTKRHRKKPARPIKTKRDYERAAAIVQRLSGQSGQDSAAELRLQVLLKELDRFDSLEEEEANADSPGEYDYAGPRRRWTDDTPGSE